MEQPNFWDDVEKSQEIMKQLKEMQEIVKESQELDTLFEEIKILLDMGYEEEDESIVAEVNETFSEFKE